MLLQTFIAIGLFAFVSSEIVSYNECYPQNPDWNGNCTVSSVRVTPCPQAESKKPCIIKRGNSAKVEFEYTSTVNVNEVESKAFWVTGNGMDLPWVDMDNSGCKHTKCPIQKDVESSYTYELIIGKKYPARNFDVKWKLEKEGEMECCFIFKIKLVK